MYINHLIEKLGSEKISREESDLELHSYDASPHEAVKPDVVCFPENKEDVKQILETAQSFHIPVTPYGIGSGLEGAAIPVQNGITINFKKMNQILAFSPEDMTITVQPGITRVQLNEYLQEYGLQFPIDPSTDASLGGMVATNASGSMGARYGAMKDQILDLEVVLADGSVIHTGTKAKKSSSGYLVTNLFVGSEGTLGIVTEITLKLYGIPEETVMARCTFDSLEACAKASQAISLKGIPLMRLELIDKESIEELNRQNQYAFPEAHSLFLEFGGNNRTVEQEIQLVYQMLQKLGTENWAVSNDPEEQADIWRARKELSVGFVPEGMSEVGADVCVPVSRLPEMLTYARKLIQDTGLRGGVWGHVGDGNFHTLVLFDPNVDGERERAESTNEALAKRAIEVGGTCTGEHGVGLGKKKYQELEHGQTVRLMKGIKQLLDPNGILNPGKVF